MASVEVKLVAPCAIAPSMLASDSAFECSSTMFLHRQQFNIDQIATHGSALPACGESLHATQDQVCCEMLPTGSCTFVRMVTLFQRSQLISPRKQSKSTSKMCYRVVYDDRATRTLLSPGAAPRHAAERRSTAMASGPRPQ